MAETKWYIRPENDETNNCICDTMTRMNLLPKETKIKFNNEDLPVLESTSAFVNYLTGGKIGLHFKYRVFWEDAVGTTREWRLHEKAIRKKAKTRRWGKMVKTGLAQ